MREPRALSSLSTELIANFAVLAAAALIVAMAALVLAAPMLGTRAGVVYLGVMLLADVAVVAAFGAWQVRRIIVRPLADAVSAAEAIAEGDLDRRVPAGTSAELDALARSVNRMTDRLLQERAQLVRAEKLAGIGRLAAGVAHEIGNPLGAIHGYVHLLRRRVSDNPAALDAVGGLDRETGRIDRIVRGLLDYARARRATPARVDLGEVARSVHELLAAQGLFRDVDVRVELPAPDAPPALVLGERHELEQALVNLCMNAVDAMEGLERRVLALLVRRTSAEALRSGVSRRAEDRGAFDARREPSPRLLAWLEAAGQPEEVAQVIVADAGPGIPAGDAERIFDPFFTTKPPGKGTGLGLAIVARIVDNHHGAVWAQPSRERGAALVLVFPAVRADVPAGIRQALPAPVRAVHETTR